MNFDPMILERQILETDKVTYYSCRAPDGEYFLVARPQKAGFAEKIIALQARHEELLDSIGFGEMLRCRQANCAFRRNCTRMNFWPRLCERVELKTEGSYVLNFDCFVFGNLITASDLLADYCITVPTAYRLTIGLLTLVDRMIREGVYAEISVENLFIDTQFAMPTLVDWSEAEVFDMMSFQKMTALYQQVAKVIFRLTQAEHSTEGWNCPAGFEEPRMQKLFDILKEVEQTQVEIPEKLDEAIDYVRDLREKQTMLIQRIATSLTQVKFESGKPLFEVMKRKERVEEENG